MSDAVIPPPLSPAELTPDSAPIAYETALDGALAYVTLNRPDSRNALSSALRKQFFAALSGRNTLSDALAATIATPTAFQSAAGDVRGGATGPFPLPAPAEPAGPSTVEVKQLALGPSRRRMTLALSALLIAALAIAGLAVAFGREASPATPAPAPTPQS